MVGDLVLSAPVSNTFRCPCIRFRSFSRKMPSQNPKQGFYVFDMKFSQYRVRKLIYSAQKFAHMLKKSNIQTTELHISIISILIYDINPKNFVSPSFWPQLRPKSKCRQKFDYGGIAQKLLKILDSFHIPYPRQQNAGVL